MNKIIKILAQYDIPESSPVELIRESGDNQVYVVGSSDKRILRISKRLPIEDVKFEFEALKHLSDGGFSVPEWVNTANGQIFASAPDIEVAVMFTFLNGFHVPVGDSEIATKEQAFAAGSALGAIAEIGQTFKPHTIRHRNIFTELQRTLQNADVFERDFEGGAAFVSEVKRAIKFGQESVAQVGLIHNDYRPGNVFFESDNKISGVIDFDWSCIGPCIKDLALGVLEWSSPDGKTEPDFAVFDSFLDGYSSISSQKVSKNQELYSWIMFAALSDTSTYFCDRLGSPDLKKKISYSYMYKKYQFFARL